MTVTPITSARFKIGDREVVIGDMRHESIYSTVNLKSYHCPPRRIPGRCTKNRGDVATDRRWRREAAQRRRADLERSRP